MTIPTASVMVVLLTPVFFLLAETSSHSSGSSFAFVIRRKGNTQTNVGSITKEGKTLPKEDYEASSQMPLLIYTMAVGRMANVGVSVERDAVSNVRRTGWCFTVVIMSRQHDQKAMR